MKRAGRENTRERLLAEACRAFGEKGWRGTRTQDVCRAAGVNAASVNYHFGGKDALYRAVWEKAAVDAIAMESALPPKSSNNDREWLYCYVHAYVRAVFDQTGASLLHRLIERETEAPSPESKELFARHVAPRRAELESRMRRLLPEGASPDQVALCVFAVNAQFSALARDDAARRAVFGATKPSRDRTERFARDMCALLIGGLRSIKAFNERPEK